MRRIVFALVAIAALAGCNSSGPADTGLPPPPKTMEDKERLIRENTQLSPEQKERELARIKASQ